MRDDPKAQVSLKQSSQSIAVSQWTSDFLISKGTEMNNKKEIGLAIVGCGTIGRIRAELARAYPGVGWIGLCDLKSDIGDRLAKDVRADFYTNDFRELIARPEVTATIIATDENFHFDPTMAAIERGHDLFIEKPLATERLSILMVSPGFLMRASATIPIPWSSLHRNWQKPSIWILSMSSR